MKEVLRQDILMQIQMYKFFEGKELSDIEKFVKKNEELYSLNNFQVVMTGQGIRFFVILCMKQSTNMIKP